MAQELGSKPGDEVGWHVRFDKRCTDRSRIVAMTEGIALRRLQADPFLEGVSAVLLDEFHERSLLSDLALALLAEVRTDARPDLVVGVMSATLDPEPVARFLGGCPVVRSAGRTFPVTVEHVPRDVDDPATGVADAARRALAEEPGDVLAFLPGVREIRNAGRALHGVSAEVVPLYGALPAAEQDRALRPGTGRRVVLATNLAETSVTVPGVRTVVDSGWVRRPRFEAATGLDGLHTERISRASAEQRSGRAGRTAPGRAVRLWTERVHRSLAAYDPAELHRVDLSGACLQLLAWGVDPAAFGWFEAPAPHVLEGAMALLTRLGAVTDGSVTARGREMASLPVHPRLAAMLLAARERGASEAACRAAAALAEGNVRPQGGVTADSDLEPLDVPPRVERVATQLARILGPRRGAAPQGLGRAVLAGWPDRVAQRRGTSDRARMVGGRGVRLDPRSAVTQAPLFVCIEVDDAKPEGRVRVAAAVEPAWLEVEESEVCAFDEASGSVRAHRQRRYGDLVLASHPVQPEPVAAARALLRAAGTRLRRAVSPDPAFAGWLARLGFVARHDLPPGEWPAPDDALLRELLEHVCAGRRSLAALRDADWTGALRDHLGWERFTQLGRLAPERLDVPSGRSVRLDYTGDVPVLAVRMQELFGSARTPTVGGGRIRVRLHLLAPNGRPQQITDDLEGFWTRTWPEVRKELRARYPKHPWPEDPRSAAPTSHAKRRRRR